MGYSRVYKVTQGSLIKEVRIFYKNYWPSVEWLQESGVIFKRYQFPYMFLLISTPTLLYFSFLYRHFEASQADMTTNACLETKFSF